MSLPIPKETIHTQFTSDRGYKDACHGQVPVLCGEKTKQGGKCRRNEADCKMTNSGKSISGHHYAADDDFYLPRNVAQRRPSKVVPRNVAQRMNSNNQQVPQQQGQQMQQQQMQQQQMQQQQMQQQQMDEELRFVVSAEPGAGDGPNTRSEEKKCINKFCPNKDQPRWTKECYKTNIRKFHPNTHINSSQKEKENAMKKFIELNDCKDVAREAQGQEQAQEQGRVGISIGTQTQGGPGPAPGGPAQGQVFHIRIERGYARCNPPEGGAIHPMDALINYCKNNKDKKTCVDILNEIRSNTYTASATASASRGSGSASASRARASRGPASGSKQDRRNKIGRNIVDNIINPEFGEEILQMAKENDAKIQNGGYSATSDDYLTEIGYRN
jgi:hypothetical protein